jgi:uridine kinase
MVTVRVCSDLVLVSGMLLVGMYMMRLRSQKAKLLKITTNDEAELQLVQDIVYNSVSPEFDALSLKRKTHSLNEEGNPILVVGVCGGSGSGKTTLSRAIIHDFGADRVTYLSHDYYYKDLGHLTMEQRAEHNFDHPDSLETNLLVDHLKKLRSGQAVNIPVYDFGTHSRRPETIIMKPNKVILVEGILIFADPELASLMDIKIFVETAADIRLIRRLKRDISERQRTAESVMKQYMKTVRPMHMMFVESSKRVADIIIPQGVNSVALDMILSRLHSFSSATAEDTEDVESREEKEAEL